MITQILLFIFLLPAMVLAQQDAKFENDVNQAGEEIIKEAPEGSALKATTLKEILSVGLRINPEQKIRNFQSELFDLSYQKTHYEFWFPELTFSIETFDHEVHSFTQNNNTILGAEPSPYGQFAFGFQDYTLFNWGRDYLDFISAKRTYKRNLGRLSEDKRRLRFKLIYTYFDLIRARKILKTRKLLLRHTSFVHRISRERLGRKKIKYQEFVQAKTEFALAQSEYHAAVDEHNLIQEELLNLLGEDQLIRYKPLEELKYVTVNFPEHQAFSYALQNAPTIKDAKLAYENAERDYRRTLKDNLPLPELTLDLGAYRQNFGTNNSNSFYGNRLGTSRDVELRASINMTWDIIGGDGFLNSRTKKGSFINAQIGEINYKNAKRTIKQKVRSLYQSLKFTERNLNTLIQLKKIAETTFDQTMDNYIRGKTTFPDFKYSLDRLRETLIELENRKVKHLEYKLDLAFVMGKDDIPGNNFEELVVSQ